MTVTPWPQPVVVLVLGLSLVGQARVLAVFLALVPSRQDSRTPLENPSAEGEVLLSRGGKGNSFSFNRGTVTGREEDGSRQNNRRQYESPAAEVGALFNCGGSSSNSHSFNRVVN